MGYILTEEDKIWIENVIDKGITNVQMKKKLKEANYNEERIQEFLKYYEKSLPKIEIKEERNIKEEKEFEKKVKKYQENPYNLGWLERKKVKSWLNNVRKYIKAIDETIIILKKEIETISEKFGKDNMQLTNELEDLKSEMIDAVINSKDIMIIEHPYKEGVEATKENLTDVELVDILELLEDSNNELKLIVNGKI